MAQEPYDDELLEEVDDDVLRPRATTAGQPRQPGLSKPLVVLAVLVGVVLSVWMMGKPATTSNSSNPSNAAAMPTSATTAPLPTKAELLARIDKDPNDAEAHLQLGLILFEDEDDYEGARQQWELVTQIDPTIAEAWYNLGFYYADKEPPDCANASAMWAKVVDINPQSDLANNVLNHMIGVCSEEATSPTDAATTDTAPTDASPSETATGG